MVVVAVAPIENKPCHIPCDVSFRSTKLDTQRGSTMGGEENVVETNTCNIINHPETSYGSNCKESNKDLILDTKNSVSSAASGTADTLSEGYKERSTVVDESLHDVDTVTISSLSERQLVSQEQYQVEGQVHCNKNYFEEDPLNSRISDASGKQACGMGLEEESALESDMTQNAGPELSESQIPECPEREIIFQNGASKQESVIDLSTSSMLNGFSSSASLPCDECHCINAEDGNALDKQEITDVQKITYHTDEFDQALKDSKAVGTQKCNCCQNFHDKRLEQASENSRKLKLKRFCTISANDQSEEKDQSSSFQSNDSHDDDGHIGIILCDNSGSMTAEGEHIAQMSEVLLANTSMNDKDSKGHKQDDHFDSISLNSCGQININESNSSNLQDIVLGDSSTVLESPLNEEPSEFKTSLPELSSSNLQHRGQGLFSQRNLPADGMQRGSNLQSSRNENEVKMIFAERKEEQREASALEMGNSTHGQENSGSLSVEREPLNDPVEPDSETRVASAKISDSNDVQAYECGPSPNKTEEVLHNSLEEATDTSKIEEEGMVLDPSDLGIVITSALNDKGAFEITQAVSDEKQGSRSGLPPKAKQSIESSNSLRMLLSADDVLASDRVDRQGFLNDRGRKDRETFEHPQRAVTLSEMGRSVNHLSQDESHVFPEKWYEDAEDNEFTSAGFSGPISFSGPVSYSGPIPHSGSLSYRSDSSTSTRSFAFPILASDWTSSPVKMSQPDSRYFRRRKRWHFCCFCCRRSSTFYD